MSGAPWTDTRTIPDLAGKSVAIVAMGPSHWEYVGSAAWKGHRHEVADEIWTINAMGGCLQCDRIFFMDHPLKAIEAEGRQWRWVHDPGPPIYTARALPELPRTVTYPLQDVLNAARYGYFNTSAAYAMGFAAAAKPARVLLFGTDFTKVEGKEIEIEAGRACMEFWIGVMSVRGIEVVLAQTTQLMDMNVPPPKKFYGYADHGIDVSVKANDGLFEVMES